ncbi:MAG TPA: ABC transporter permease [Solirubrobacterales bacterium]|jgi:lipopolysaccharide transport system permease protein|nr:ABC transporter permease [Solirubrobacterales bacterium]
MASARELWRYRDLALQIAARDVTVKYRQTALGVAWAILQPLGFMLVFSLFFGNLAGISSNGIPYPLFSLAALVPWTFFAGSLLLASDSLVTNAALVSKIYFPRIFIPAGVVVAGLVDLGISTAILFAVVLGWGLTPSPGVLLLPALVAVACAAVLGVGAALAAVNVRYRDVRYVVPFAVQLWLFATPVAYPITLLDEPWRTLSAVNPMVGVVEGFRWAVLGETAAPWDLIGISTASAALLAVAGLVYFHRAERDFADIV